MHSLFKILACIGTICCLIIYSVIYLGEKTIPDKITIIENENYEVPQIFGVNLYNFKTEKEVRVAFENVKTLEKTTEVKLLNIIPVKNTVITNAKRQYVVLGGEIFGIKLYTDGVIVVDIDEIETDNGFVSPGKESGIKKGDIVKSVNNKIVTSSSHFSKILQESKGNEIEISLQRESKKIDIKFRTVKEKDSEKYKAGLWVRDSTAGLGTVTFYNTKNNTFAGLGHPIYDIDTNEIMPIKTGIMAEATISGLYKSTFGNVGELCGTLTGKNRGSLCLNDKTGLYGYCSTEENNHLPVAVKQEVHEGKAQIRCTVDNTGPLYYDIEIMKIYSNSASVNKDMIIKVTDEKLLTKTGGIVQGMSGSPIIQNGMLVGAVTHVFVNNPKQGYAIFAERMLETSNKQETRERDELLNAS